MSIIDKIESLVTFLENIIPLSIKEAFEENKNFVLSKQKEQLSKGEYKQSVSIRPTYSPAYKKLKRKLSNTPNLRDTGTFYDSIRLDVRETYAEIITEDPKAKYLFSRYERAGNDLFGLQDGSIVEFVDDFVIPIINKKIDELIRT